MKDERKIKKTRNFMNGELLSWQCDGILQKSNHGFAAVHIVHSTSNNFFLKFFSPCPCG